MNNELDKESSEKAKITHSDVYQRKLKDCKVSTVPALPAGCRFAFAGNAGSTRAAENHVHETQGPG